MRDGRSIVACDRTRSLKSEVEGLHKIDGDMAMVRDQDSTWKPDPKTEPRHRLTLAMPEDLNLKDL